LEIIGGLIGIFFDIIKSFKKRRIKFEKKLDMFRRTYFFVLISLISTAKVFSITSAYGNNGENSHQDSVALENEYFKVMQNSVFCHTANTPDFGTRVIVALSTVKIKSSKGTQELERGGVAVFLENISYQKPTGEFFEVAFKKNHPPLKSPEEWIEPDKNTIVFEDEQFRIFEERLAPGDTRELHSHAQRIVVRLNEVQLTDPRKNPNGTPGGGIQVPNTVKFAEPMVHVVKNLSTHTPLFNIVIEFKLPN